jgi:site-specific recombinase XerD
VKEILDGTTDLLVNEYPDMFKPTSKCRPPHLHVDTLREQIFDKDVISRHDIKSVEQFRKYIAEVNEKLLEISDEEWGKKLGIINSKGVKSTSIEKAIAKARKFKFFLGLDSSWLDA